MKIITLRINYQEKIGFINLGFNAIGISKEMFAMQIEEISHENKVKRK